MDGRGLYSMLLGCSIKARFMEGGVFGRQCGERVRVSSGQESPAF